MTRNGNFSSSEIWKLTGLGERKMTPDELAEHKKEFPKSRKQNTKCMKLFDAKGTTYIEEKRMELRLGRSLSSDHGGYPTMWGKLVEAMGFDRMGLEYQLVSKVRYSHPTIPHWTGMPDVITNDLCGDLKSPWNVKSFCEMVDAMSEGPEKLKEVKPEYYFQLVSNCILTGKSKAGLFVYCPYREDLKEVRERAAMNDDEKLKLNFIIFNENDYELPFLIKGNHYKDINELIFEVPQSDIDFLEERVSNAVKLLN